MSQTLWYIFGSNPPCEQKGSIDEKQEGIDCMVFKYQKQEATIRQTGKNSRWKCPEAHSSKLQLPSVLNQEYFSTDSTQYNVDL